MWPIYNESSIRRRMYGKRSGRFETRSYVPGRTRVRRTADERINRRERLRPDRFRVRRPSARRENAGRGGGDGGGGGEGEMKINGDRTYGPARGAASRAPTAFKSTLAFPPSSRGLIARHYINAGAHRNFPHVLKREACFVVPCTVAGARRIIYVRIHIYIYLYIRTHV